MLALDEQTAMLSGGMSDWGTTSWRLIRGAASGNADDRAAFAARYGGPLRAYFAHLLAGRHPGSREVDDLVNDVFVECYRPDGALAKADPARGGFQAFLLGVARNVALRSVTRGAPGGSDTVLDTLPAEDTSASRAYDRACAQQVMQQARARMGGVADGRLVELLRLRTVERMTLAQIAEHWSEPVPAIAKLNEDAKSAFEQALLDVIKDENPGASSADVLARARGLLAILAR